MHSLKNELMMIHRIQLAMYYMCIANGTSAYVLYRKLLKNKIGMQHFRSNLIRYYKLAYDRHLSLIRNILETRPGEGILRTIIMLAIKSNNFGLIRYIASIGYRYDCRDVLYPIYDSKNRSASVILRTIKLVMSFRPIRNRFAIIVAARSGNLKVVKYFVSLGFDPTFNDNEAILAACATGNLKIVKFLISCGCDPQARDNSGIRYAIARNQLRMVKYLISNGCEIGPDSSYDIGIICSSGHIKMLKYLVALNLNPMLFHNGMYQAIRDGKLGVVRCLTTYGVSAKDFLTYACQTRQWDVAKYLMTVTEDRSDALLWPIMYDNVEMVRMMCASNYLLSLCIAVVRCKWGIVKELIKMKIWG